MLPRSSLNMQFRTAYKIVTDELGSDPKTNQEILDRAGDHILLTEIVRGKFASALVIYSYQVNLQFLKLCRFRSDSRTLL